MGCGGQFVLLLWKNWLLQKRKKALTVFEITIPIFLALVMFALRQTASITLHTNPTTWDTFSIDAFSEDLRPPGCGSGGSCTWKLAFYPNNTVTRRMMSTVANISGVDIDNMGYTDEETMKDFLRLETTASKQTLAGIVFNVSFPTDNSLPDKVIYKIRMKSAKVTYFEDYDWFTNEQYPVYSGNLGPRQKDESNGGIPGYYQEGFLTLQRAVDGAIIIERNPSAAVDLVDNIILQMQRHPYPPYNEDEFIAATGSFLPQIIVLCFIILAPSIAKDIVIEKEKKLKESMKLMGLTNILHWTAWFLKYLAFLTVSVIFITIFFKLDAGKGPILNLTNGLLFFIFLFLYSIAIIFQNFAISTFFSGSNVAAAAAGILFYVSYIPYFFIDTSYGTMTLSQKLASCLLPNCAMGIGFRLITNSELAGVGTTWSNFNEVLNTDENITFGHVLLFLIIDSLIFYLITWYVDAVNPGEYGVPKPFYFCFTKWYWCGTDRVSNSHFDADKTNSGDLFEETSPNIPIGIQIKGLRKEFKKRGANVVAVEDMYMDMHEGQITALLGHNGAGKTTTMYMLTGFLPPTRGTAFVNGYDIGSNITKVRRHLGLCPQHDVLFDNMTVREHLIFFAKLKGTPSNEVDKEVNEMIKVLRLEHKRDVFSKSLSGGMKRKLSVGIALIGGSKVVVLDEPTSGMDPEARRQTWDILQSQRADRTILLTTHFMDEADYLGDRIAIMASGKLVCCGSSLFLKKKYGVGYHMVMVKEPRCDVNTVDQVIKKYVPDAKIESNISAELSYILPNESSPQFEALFTDLETNKVSLGICSFGASVTTMEEVFLKVGEGQDEELEKTLQNKNFDDKGKENKGYIELSINSPEDNLSRENTDNSFSDIKSPDVSKSEEDLSKANGRNGKRENGHSNKVAPVFGVEFQRNTGIMLQLQQFWAMFLKRFINSWRSPVVSIVQIFVPCLFVALACVTITLSGDSSDPEPLNINYTHFTDPVVPYQKVDNGYTSVINMVNSLENALSNVVEVVSTNNAISDYLAEIAENDFQKFINSYLVGAYFEGGYNASNVTGDLIKMYFNNEAIHSPALALNSLGNTLIAYFTGETKYDIEVINHPIPKPASIQATDSQNTAFALGFTISINVTFGMGFLIATFIVFAIKENRVKAKHCQFVSGVSTTNFWMSAYAWDMINYLIPVFVIMIIIAAFNVEGYLINNNLGYVFLTFLMYGLSVLPFVYALSFLFDEPSSGYVWIAVINIFTGIAATITVSILKAIESTKSAGEILEWVFFVTMPNFCFAYSLQEIYTNYNNKKTCDDFVTNMQQNSAGLYTDASLNEICDGLKQINITTPCCPGNCGDFCIDYYENYLTWKSPGIGRGILFMAIQIFAFFAIVFFLESGLAKRLKQKIVSGAASLKAQTDEEAIKIVGGKGSPSKHAQQDSDVQEEKDRIMNTNMKDLTVAESLILYQLEKYYGNFLAVDHLNVGIKQGECFGLLGVNGAGKTTTFKMLTGDETITHGKAFLCGHNVSKNIKQVQQNVGYCPQFDALIDKMTVAETLSMYARLRGVKESDVKNVVDNLIENLLIGQYRNKQAGTLSGGNKRKLSTAIALVGDPPVVFLDEPTTGMDPVARRLLWNTLTQVRESGRTLVLTSHSMEECEALCTRIAIMVNGQFKCLGSCQRLKTKFGEGYTLMAKVTPSDKHKETEARTENLMEFIETQFPGSTLKDLHHGLVLYQINSQNLSWARVFGTMERAKETYYIEDYSVSQTTLEQVFINFARSQVPPLDEKIPVSAQCKSCCKLFCCCCC